jgi:hypothetical protein
LQEHLYYSGSPLVTSYSVPPPDAVPTQSSASSTLKVRSALLGFARMAEWAGVEAKLGFKAHPTCLGTPADSNATRRPQRRLLARAETPVLAEQILPPI